MAITYTWNKKKLAADYFGMVHQINFERKGVEDSYTDLANIILGWRSSDGVWDASFFVKNITDDVDLSHIQAYYSDYHLPGGGRLPSKFYAANTNMGRQLGAQLVYNF